jgi:hypothetical protein
VATVFISYTRQDSDIARYLADELAARGATPWLDSASVPLGARWDLEIRKAIDDADAVVVLVSKAWNASSYAREEVSVAQRAERLVIPIVIDDAEIPFELSHIQFMRIADARDLRWAAEEITSVVDRFADATRKRTDLADGGALVEVALQFFRKAGRTVQRSSANPQLLEPPGAWICRADIPDATEVRSFAPYVGARGQSAYFCYESRLTDDAEAALDELRVRGTPMVPLSSRIMRSALADGRTKDLLRELEHEYQARDNLFETLNALVDERFMFGRAQLLTRLGGAIRSGEHVLLTGLRKAGKTSLLNIVRQHLDDRPVCMVDLQRYDRHAEDWPPLLFALMLDAYDSWAASTIADWPFGPTDAGSGTELERALAKRAAWRAQAGLPSAALVVVLDEIERVFPASGEVEAAARFRRATGALRAIGQGSERLVSVIAADLRPIANRTNILPGGETNPFFNWLNEIPVPVLSEQATAEMIHSLARAMGIRTVDRPFTKAIYARTGGHPALARILASAAARHRALPERLNVDDLRAGSRELDETDRVGSFLKQNFWDLTSPTEREVLIDLTLKPRTTRLRSARGRRSVTSITGKEALGSLVQQGLVRDGRVTIGAYADWLSDHAEELIPDRG